MAARGGPGDPLSLVERVGARRQWGRDFYASLLAARWRWVFLLIAASYLVLNALFAGVYLLAGDCIAGARPGSFADAFFFNVQTVSTLGYGVMSPKGLCGNLIVTAEAIVGLILLALATGLVFAKFSRPTARVLFSRKAVVSPRDGVPCLMFRLASERPGGVVEASVRAVVLLWEETREGERLRRLHDLALLRSATPVFANSWLVVHPIDARSPLRGRTREELEAERARVIVSFTGIDGAFSATVHANHAYGPEDLCWGGRFADIVTPLPDGRIRLDLARFHDVIPAEEPPGACAGVG